ncbi:hypothetical protein GCM10020219_032880 [Nonomuraea dietziae]
MRAAGLGAFAGLAFDLPLGPYAARASVAGSAGAHARPPVALWNLTEPEYRAAFDGYFGRWGYRMADVCGYEGRRPGALCRDLGAGSSFRA